MTEENRKLPRKVLVVRRGFGSREKCRFRTIASLCEYVEMPATYNVDMTSEEEAKIYAKRIEDFRPDILVGCSSGASVICHLVRTAKWRGCTWIVSLRTSPPSLARSLSTFCEDLPILFSHGTEDGVPPRHIKEHIVPGLTRSKVLPFDGGHSAIGLFSSKEEVSKHLELAYSLRLSKPRAPRRPKPSLFDALKRNAG